MKFVDASEPWNALPEVGPADVVVATTWDELLGLASCIGEALQAVDDWEFQARVGIDPDEARRLHGAISDILRTQPPSS